MKYSDIYKGKFLERPNRFIAICEIDGKKEICHVKNTGRCRELLVKGATVYLEKSS
ncbi:MAG: DNA/RNA nuclease SfsA, partial [Clostridia bacterium]|nr:DNA/RNA nuclease SfsA [Clostridia bacterium]